LESNKNEDDYAASGPHRRRRIEDPAKPTTLSLVKNLKRNDRYVLTCVETQSARISSLTSDLLFIKH
jgi:hypothetical protein